MNVIKRSGKEVIFNINKIHDAVMKANESVEDHKQNYLSLKLI